MPDMPAPRALAPAAPLSYAIMWAETRRGPRLLLVDPDAPAALRCLVGRPTADGVAYEGTARGNGPRDLDAVHHAGERLLPRYIPSDVARDARPLAHVLPHGQRFMTVDWGDIYARAEALARAGVGALERTPADVRLAPFERIRVARDSQPV